MTGSPGQATWCSRSRPGAEGGRLPWSPLRKRCNSGGHISAQDPSACCPPSPGNLEGKGRPCPGQPGRQGRSGTRPRPLPAPLFPLGASQTARLSRGRGSAATCKSLSVQTVLRRSGRRSEQPLPPASRAEVALPLSHPQPQPPCPGPTAAVLLSAVVPFCLLVTKFLTTLPTRRKSKTGVFWC